MIDIENIIVSYGFDRKEIASQLFPKSKHPELALKRIISGDGSLNTKQISKLSIITGVSVPDLFKSTWSASFERNELKFSRNGFKVLFNPKTGLARIYDSNSLFHEIVLTTSALTLSSFIKEIDSLIKTHKNENCN